MGDVAVGSDDAQLIDELRQGEAAPTRAHRRERRGVLALPQVGQGGRARLGPFGLGVGLAQVDDEARLHPRNRVFAAVGVVVGSILYAVTLPAWGALSFQGRPMGVGEMWVGGPLPSSSRGSL